MTLQAIPVRVEQGVVRSMDGSPLPEQAYALLVIVPELPGPGDTESEWRRPFDAFFEHVQQAPPNRSLDQVSEAELNALVHRARSRN